VSAWRRARKPNKSGASNTNRKLSTWFRCSRNCRRHITAGCVRNLKAKSETAGERPTEDVEAYQLYCKAFSTGINGLKPTSRKPRLFHASRPERSALCLVLRGFGRHLTVCSGLLTSPSEAWPKAKAAAMRALEIDGTSRSTHLPRLVKKHFEWDWRRCRFRIPPRH